MLHLETSDAEIGSTDIVSAGVASTKSSGSQGHELGLKIILLTIKRILSFLLLYAS